MRSIRLSVVIPSHNNLDMLKICVRSWEIVKDVDYELIIIEDGCSDGTPEWLESVANGERIRWFHEDDVYETLSDNRGMREARGEYVLIWQDDMFVRHPHLASWVLSILDYYPEMSVLSLKRGVIFLPLQYKPGSAEPTINPGHSHFQRFGTPFCVAEVQGCVKPWIVRRKCIEQCGILDEAYRPFHFDEMDYHLRLRANGGRIGTIPAEQMKLYIHCASSSTSKHNKAWFESTIQRNGALLHSRWDTKKEVLNIPQRKVWPVPDIRSVFLSILNYYLFHLKALLYYLRNGFPK